MLLLVDLFLRVNAEGLIVKFISGKSTLLAFPLIDTCPFFLMVYNVLWGLYKNPIFKIEYYEDFVILQDFVIL